MDRLLGGFFSRFNRFFNRSSEAYSGGVKRALHRKRGSIAIYVVMLGATVLGFAKVPSGFVPIQDKGYLVNLVQLPNGATLERTEAVVRQMTDIASRSRASATRCSSRAVAEWIHQQLVLGNGVLRREDVRRDARDWRVRPRAGRCAAAEVQRHQGCLHRSFPAAARAGARQQRGFKLQIEDRGDAGYLALSQTVNAVLRRRARRRNWWASYSTYNVTTPQLFADVDRTKASQLGIDVDDVFKAMQIYLGSLYVNDFNKFGRTYQVIAQGDADFRSSREDILRLKMRNSEGRRWYRWVRWSRRRHEWPRECLALQRLSFRRSQWRPGARLFHGTGAGSHHEDPGRNADQANDVRMDRTGLPADPGRQYRADRVPYLHIAGVPGADRPVRVRLLAACHHHDRADVPVRHHQQHDRR